MKKSLLAIVVGALAVASTANAGLFAEGDLGLSRTKLSNGGSSKTKIEPRVAVGYNCLLYTSPSPRDRQKSRMPSSA